MIALRKNKMQLRQNNWSDFTNWETLQKSVKYWKVKLKSLQKTTLDSEMVKAQKMLQDK